jgi:hypothetical protein
MVNQREIDFAGQTAERAVETSEAMTAYLKKLIYVIIHYIDAAKIPGKDAYNNFEKCRFSVGKWNIFVDGGGEWRGHHEPILHFSYEKRLLAKIQFWEMIEEVVVEETAEEKRILKKRRLDMSIEKLDVENLQYITSFVEEIDKRLTDMQIMASKVL